MTKYCETCTNANTPICEECSYVEHSKGRSKPTEYCGYDLDNADEICIGDLAALIENRVKHQHPIQLRYVMKYNKLLEERHGKKENIPAL